MDGMEVYEYNWGRKRTCRTINIAGLAKRGDIK